ncbi:nitronate monooxygenase [Bradyrhizobium prioriisuperbiae]|uniref:NAD(P)H-dependent flavin oxidoreductase n=1 Tax=Bradyrhizobium prioriisuperbiae TaxID=2854389 RepID=UPI0028E6A4E2|nr:nitronate monooxygenase [Bradyrhizobium prioritasuperba]
MNKKFGDASLVGALDRRMSLPVIVAPMFLVSSVGLVVEACRAGVIGSMPTLNARTPEILDEWLRQIGQSEGIRAPFAMNIIAHSSNDRFDDDLDVVAKHRVPLVISSVGNPARVVDKVRGYGGHVFADVASIKHALRAAKAGVDGLVLLCAGAGGHTGWLNPFAFVDEVRCFFDGPIALAGGLSNGRQVGALKALGVDYAYMGTRFLASEESNANQTYRQMVVDSGADDIVLTSEVSGMPANMLRLSLERSELHGKQPPSGKFEMSSNNDSQRAWRDVWGAGHGVGGVREAEPIREIVSRLRTEFADGLSASRGH